MLNVKDNSRFFKKALKIKSDRVKSAIQRALADASAFQVDAIRDRTEQRGKDVKGRPFKPYSKSYIQAKRKRFNDPSNQDTTPKNFVDLNFTGKMFSSLTFITRPSRGVLFLKALNNPKKHLFIIQAKEECQKENFWNIIN